MKASGSFLLSLGRILWANGWRHAGREHYYRGMERLGYTRPDETVDVIAARQIDPVIVDFARDDLPQGFMPWEYAINPRRSEKS